MTTTHVCSIWQGSLILVNAGNPYHAEAARDALAPLGEPQCGIYMERRAAALLCKLMDDIHGWNDIVAVSGWRSEREQRDIWNTTLQESGEEFTRQYVAVPGCSEHQTGLAIDLGKKSADLDFIRPDFPNTGVCRTFRERAAKYGFIERYPTGKERITGISCEPWHFRYVGAPHAEIMVKLGLTLEEYHEFIRQYRFGLCPLLYESGRLEFSLSYLALEEAEALPEAVVGGMVSGNNRDGFVVTTWKERG